MIKSFSVGLIAITATVAALASPLPLEQRQIERKGSAAIDFSRENANAIRIRFNDPGWDSGVRIAPPRGNEFWDLSSAKALAADVENLSPDRQLRLTMHISSGSSAGRDHADTHSGVAVNPGQKGTIYMLLPHRTIFKAPDGVPGPYTLETDKINSIEFYMQWHYEGVLPDLLDCKITNIRLIGAPDTTAKVPADEYFPFIDVYGQYKHGDWPEKIHQDADLVDARELEAAELSVATWPTDWNRFGGWASGPQLEATGAFRVQKHNGKWYLVDPEGRLFFSHGIDVLRAHTDPTQLNDKNRQWFDFEPNGQRLPFTDWNLRKKYGQDDYHSEFYDTLIARLSHWGFNTIGNWSDSLLMDSGRVPYTLQLTDHNRNLPQIGNGQLKFYDVFDPAYIAAMENLVQTAAAEDPLIAKSLSDPFCIGYFIDNELNFGNRNGQILGDLVLKSPATQAAKQVFVDDLRAKYDSITALNTAWGTQYESWDVLLHSQELPAGRGYMPDSDAFFLKAVDQYFRLCREAIKSVAPHRLYLGTRFISTDAPRRSLYEASAKYSDVLSVNIYSHTPANFGLLEGFPDMPVLIGEFHLGVMDRGMFAPGLVRAGLTQEDRALAYTRFLQGALANPKIVGAHWFQFRDQPLTGRWDGEGYAIGFVDVADTPYTEMTEASREVGDGMYQYRERGTLTDSMR